ncbi:MAG: hypothetical protein IT449_02385 [Phycisphaerales bacterium]|nr:hypothetical protein [Phycisphaerales bacterium]
MKETTRNALVGLFVIGSLAVLAALMVMFGERPEWLGGVEWAMRIRGVSQLRDIREGNEVTLNGVAIGRVDRLEFKDDQRPGLGVDIVVLIKNDFSVPASARALVYGPTLGIGRGIIEIVVDDPLSGAVLSKDDTAEIRGEMANRLNEIVSEEAMDSFRITVEQIGQFAEELTPVARDMHGLLERRTVGEVDQPLASAEKITANLSTAIERFDATLKNINDVLGDATMKEDFKTVASRLHEAGDKLNTLLDLWRSESQQLADNVNTGVDRTEQHLDEFFAAANDVLENLDDASDQVALAARELNEGKGTAALMLKDPRLYESMVYSFQRLGELIATLQPLAEKIAEEERIPIKVKTAVGNIPTSIDLKKKDEKSE